MDPKRPAATLIPYSVASALWSDAAAKLRFFALPDNTTINVKECPRDAAQCAPVEEGGGYEEPGDWIFPVGTVFVKTFMFGDRIVETRLLMRSGEFDFWGYSYEWRADQTDADLIPADGEFANGKDVMIQGPNGMQSWHFPSRVECGTCHTSPAGTSLGPETQQLNTDYTYPNGVTGNQIQTLDHIGVFTASPADMPALPSLTDTSAPVEARARAYMHANCSMCHRPGSTFTGFDARFSVPFADMQLCNVTPEKGNLGVMDAMRITPGDPAASVVSLRMHTRDVGMLPSVQMPILATYVVDDTGVGVIDEWITSLTGCP
jgi:cytochrome c551/c552